MSKVTRWMILWILPAVFLGTGCQSYNWRTDFEQAEQQARQNNKYVFVFYKYWLDDDSNRMLSNEVLSDPQVVVQFQDTVNLLLDKDFPAFGTYVSRYGVKEPPAAIVIAPNGAYQAHTGFMSKEQLLAFIEKAKTQSCPPPATISQP